MAERESGLLVSLNNEFSYHFRADQKFFIDNRRLY
jgi:hypothetical protein